jgi:hypothetical protein
MARRSPPFVHAIQQENHGKKIEVWFQDEARIGQQGTLTSVWAQKGSRPTAVKQTEYEWVYVFAAVNPVNGKSSAMIAPTVNTDYMNHHLRFISQEAGQDAHVALVLDQAGWHVAKNLKSAAQYNTDAPASLQPGTQPSRTIMGIHSQPLISAIKHMRITSSCSMLPRRHGTKSLPINSKQSATPHG